MSLFVHIYIYIYIYIYIKYLNTSTNFHSSQIRL